MELQEQKNRITDGPDLSSRSKVIFIVSLFVAISLLFESMLYFQANIFDGVRSYVRGEGLWAKAQKDAVLYLERYSYSHSESDYRAYTESVGVMLGDKKARLALQETPAKLDQAREGFLQGQNAPADVDSLIWFFQHFQNISYMRDAIEIWRIADELVIDLMLTAQDIRLHTDSPSSSPQQELALRARLQNLNEKLLVLENQFSAVLSEGARWVREAAALISISALIIFVGIAIIVSHEIIQRITKSERKLITSESRFRSLKESNTLGIVSWRMNGIIDEANDIFLNMLGYNRSDVEGKSINWRNLTPNEFASLDQQAIRELMRYGRCEPYEKALLHKQGYPVPIYLGASLISGDNDQGIAFVMDLSERKKAEEELKLAATVYAASNDGILITDAETHIVSANAAFCRMMGYAEDELKGKTPKILQSGHTSPEHYREMWAALSTAGHWQGEIIDRMKNGALLPMRISISGVRNRAGKLTHYVAIMSDITERKAQEEHLRRIAHHDPLTGLPNRVLFNDRMEQLIKHGTRHKGRFAVLFFDLDNFKPVNDKYGHEIGDKLLKLVANRLTMNVRATDTVTRLGGDEFVILLENVRGRAMIDEVIQKTVAAVCAPCQIDGHDIEIGISVGASVYPDDGVDAKSLIHHADVAMYGMKQNQGRRGQASSA